MKNYVYIFGLLAVLVFQACIQDDFVEDFRDPELSISNVVDTLALNTNFQFEFRYLNNIGQQEALDVSWHSMDENIISITEDGLASAINPGSTTLFVESMDENLNLKDSINVAVGEMTVIDTTQSFQGNIATTTFYELTGDFLMEETSDGIRINFQDNYEASAALPGLYVYLSNNKNSIANAFEIGEVETFSGSHEYEISGVDFNEYDFLVYFCKPFNVKVGDGDLK